MSSVYDSFRLAESEEGPDTPDFSMAEKNVIDINDNNGASYAGGQITFDLNQLVSSESFLDWSSSYITIPVQFKIQGLAPCLLVADQSNLFAMCFKGSNYSLINSINLTCSNQQLVGNTQLSNIPIEYKLLTSFNSTDVDIRGATIGFQKNNSRTFGFSNAAGEVNNFVGAGTFASGTTAPTLALPVGNKNDGMKTKLTKQAVSSTDPVITAFCPVATLQSNRTNLCYVDPADAVNTAAGTNCITYQCFVQLKMEHLHDIFKKMPLCRGALWQLVISTHLPATYVGTIASSAANTVNQATPVSTTTLNQFTPFMISTVGPTVGQNGLLSTVTTTSNWTYSAQIGFTNNTVCTMHATTYKLSPLVADRYMKDPRKRIVFEDYIRAMPASMQGIASFGPVQANISPGQSKVRGLLIVPYLAQVSGGNGTSGIMSALQSPLTSCGATVTPYAYFDNFNVMVGGRPIFPKNIAYRYDNFMREQFGINAPNGNGVWATNSGLIDADDFNAGYGYVYVNLERHLRSSDELPVSVDVSFTNVSAKTMSYVTYLFFEKEFALDCTNGKILTV